MASDEPLVPELDGWAVLCCCCHEIGTQRPLVWPCGEGEGGSEIGFLPPSPLVDDACCWSATWNEKEAAAAMYERQYYLAVVATTKSELSALMCGGMMDVVADCRIVSWSMLICVTSLPDIFMSSLLSFSLS